jgi:hypothetical protein
MAFNRRIFAKILPGGAALFGAVSASKASAPGPVLDPVIEHPAGRLTRRVFEPHVGSSFLLDTAPGSPRVLRLTAVEGVPSLVPAKHPVENSILRFACPGPELPSGLYRLLHPAMGEFEICLNPGKPGRCLALLSHLVNRPTA